MRSFACAKDVLRTSLWNAFGEDIAHDRLSEARISDSGHETKRGGGRGGVGGWDAGRTIILKPFAVLKSP